MAARLGRSLHDLVTRRGDENGALRPATSPRDEIFLLSLSLVSHENHRRRRLLECRSPPLLLRLSSTPSSSSFTTVSRLQPPVSPLLHRPLCNRVSSLALSHRRNPAASFSPFSPFLAFHPPPRPPLRSLHGFNGVKLAAHAAPLLDAIHDGDRGRCDG